MFLSTAHVQPCQGTDNMGAMYFALGHLRLPLIIFWDLLHQGVNDVLLSVNRAGMWPAILELLLVFRLPYGPGPGKNFGTTCRTLAR